MKVKFLEQVDIREKTVFIRVDFNVPLDKNLNITDDSRIRAVLPTINHCLDENAKIILASHLGRPKGPDPNLSLAPVARRLGRFLQKPVQFAPDCIGPEVQQMKSSLQPGEVLLLENLRFHPGETKNDGEFARQLMEGVDVYVNDAFAVGHRAHASVHAVVQFAPVAVAGFLLRDEIHYFHKAMEDPARPLVAIIGGAKISSKLTALLNLLQHVDKMIIGGAMANTFFKAKGYYVGKSLVDDSLIDTAKELMSTAVAKKVKFYLPVDCIVAPSLDGRAESKIVPVQEVPEDWLIADIGPATITLFNEAIQNARTIIWNGPMGAFEIDAFSRGTMAMVHHVANSFAETIVGGGDTDVAIHSAGEANKFSYISTGGGAFLELLEGKKLPGIQVLEEWYSQHPEVG